MNPKLPKILFLKLESFSFLAERSPRIPLFVSKAFLRVKKLRKIQFAWKKEINDDSVGVSSYFTKSSKRSLRESVRLKEVNFFQNQLKTSRLQELINFDRPLISVVKNFTKESLDSSFEIHVLKRVKLK